MEGATEASIDVKSGQLKQGMKETQTEWDRAAMLLASTDFLVRTPTISRANSHVTDNLLVDRDLSTNVSICFLCNPALDPMSTISLITPM